MTFQEAIGQLPLESTQHAVGFPSLFLLIALGSLVPVIPTGAVVSSVAVVALHQPLPYAVPAVFLVSALAAFTGDITLYWLGRRGLSFRGGSRWLAALRERVTAERLAQAERGLERRRVTMLVVSRLLPAGRIPVMLACLLTRMPLRRFAEADAPACLAWAAAYGLIGILGGSLFPEPWQGVLAVVALTLLISGAPALWGRLRRGGPRRGAPGGGPP
ncbi:VTT domain-containing protein [Streptomyces sp. SCSIO 30461]|uniref:DedA family protein n=1 Tax=Streptomyces sp. SCSIO 30461 TaxID=3118085 RepID=UPI0030CB6681